MSASLYESWQSAREQGDYAKADAIRDQLVALGYRPVVMRNGTTQLRWIGLQPKPFPRRAQGEET